MFQISARANAIRQRIAFCILGVLFLIGGLLLSVRWVSAETTPTQRTTTTSTTTYQDFESGAAVIDAWWNGTAANTNNSSNAHTGDWYGVITPTTNGGNGNPIFHQDDPWTAPINLDASSYDRLCIWVFDESAIAGNVLMLELQDNVGTASNQVAHPQQTAPGEWRKLCWDLADFTPASVAAIHRLLILTDGIPDSSGTNSISGPYRVDDIHFEGTTTSCAADEVQGIIFHDYNNNGIQDRAEPGINNASVTIYDAAGLSSTVTSNSTGSYSSTGTFTAGDDVRIELSVPSGFHPAASGNTSVLFSQAGTCDLDIGVYQTDQYCQDNPDVATSCYVAGVYTGTNSALDVLVSFPYDSSGIGHPMSGDTPAFSPDHDAATSEIGTTWGLAYQRDTQTLFAGAMLKRLTDFGPLGSGGIYTLDYSTTPTNPTIGEWIDLADAGGLNIATGADPRVEDGIPLSDDGAVPTRDQTAYEQVGKRALGDLELDADDTLWFINLFDQSLYGIENADPATTPTAAIGPFSIPDQIADVDCADSDVRPWGLKFHDGVLYVGVVCSAESTTLASDLHAYVLAFNPTTNSFTGTTFDFGLSDRYGCVYWLAEPDGCSWRPWGSTELVYGTNPEGFNFILNPQPILSDIEFDVDGSMILGFLDRHGHQSGLQNYSGDPADSNPNYIGMAGGDIVRVCNIGGTFELESGGICANGDTENGFGGGYSGLTNTPFGRGEYYLDDDESYPDGLTHAETSSGGLALLPGSGSLVYSAMNPIGRVNSGGLRWNSNQTGLIERGAELFQGEIISGTNPPVFGKATGIGEVELLCALPSIEVGNRVWTDTDNDGVQDPDESGLDGVTVTLTCGSDSTTTVTADGGQYFFGNDSSYDESASYKTKATFMNIGESCTISVSGASITTVDNGSNDFHDNDADSSGSIAFTVGDSGENNHSFDIGVTVSTGEACVGNLLTNGSFETGTHSGGTAWAGGSRLDVSTASGGTSPTDWYRDNSTGGSHFWVNNTNAYSGTKYVYAAMNTSFTIQDGVQIRPDASVTVQPNTSYQFCAWAADGSANGYESGIAFIVDEDSAPLHYSTQIVPDNGAWSTSATTVIPWEQYCYNFTTDAATTSLDLWVANADVGGNHSRIVYDEVCLAEITPTVNVGDFVWYDADGNGSINGNEADYGLTGVTVELISGTTTISSTTTAGGYYRFDGLTEGDYSVRIPSSNFGANNPLADYTSSATDGGDPDNNIDSDDNGNGSGTAIDIDSQIVSLAVNTEPMTTTIAGDTNHTVDFGFTAPTCFDPTDLGGDVFSDLDHDGVNDVGSGTDKSFYSSNIVVYAYDDSNAMVAQTTLRPDGTYLFDNLFATYDHIRLEFTGLPDYLDVGYSGVHNGTATQAYQAGTCSADLSVLDSAEYCETNPRLATTCFLDYTGDGKALVSWPYTQRGIASGPNGEALYSQIGTTWGLAYDHSAERIFTSAFLKRHAPLPDADVDNQGDLGAIYAISADINTTNDTSPLWLNLDGATDSNTDTIQVGSIADNVTRGISSTAGVPSADADAFDKVGKVGLGDIDLSGDGSILYAINLYQKTLHGININNDGSAGTINTYTLPDPCNANPSENGGDPYDDTDMRPFAVEYYQGDLYVGLVCSGEYSGNSADLTAYVYRFADSTNTFDSTPVLNTSLTYRREHAANHNDCDVNNREWFAWTSAWPASCGANGRIVYPQPILSDIEFTADGNLTIGLLDRMGNQGGELNADLTGNMDNGNSTAGFRVNASGDMLHATPDYDGTFTIETTWTDNIASTEFYSGDEFIEDGGVVNHREIALGALAYLPNTSEIASTGWDVVNKAEGGTFNTGGIFFSYIDDGTRDLTGQAYQVFTNTVGAPGTFGKAAGLGDLELMCQAAPLEIGNYVWRDMDGDGIQDPSEIGIGGVRVDLWLDPDGIPGNGDETLIDSTFTSISGEYYFTIQPNSTYYISIDPNDAALDGLAITTQDYASNANHPDTGISTDVHDSDGALNANSGTIIIPLTSGNAGDNDYTFDFGFTPSGMIGNFVWVDENSDGYQDAGEPGLPNVTVILRDAANTPIMTTTTDAHGGYLFSDLPLGTYSVDIVDSSIPTGMTQTSTYTNVGGDFGNQDHSGNGYSVTIGGGQPLENLSADFGYNYNPTTDVNNGTNTATLGDRIWIDTDGDGAQDPNEVGVQGVTVTLYHDSDGNGVYDTVYATTATNATGNYLFDGLPAGAYVVTVTDDANASHDILNTGNYTQTGDADHFGTIGTVNDNTTTTPVVLGPGDVFLNADFGYQPEPPGSKPPHFGSIGDTIFFDADADGNGMSLSAVDDAVAVTQGAGGSADSADYGIAGVTVNLIQDTNENGVWDTGEPILATDTTDTNGQYLFDGLAVDSGGANTHYLVWVNDSDNVLGGLTQTYDSDGVLASPNMSAVTISRAASENRSQDFGYSASTPQGSIGDTIWNDVDGSGSSTPDGGEPGIPDVTVYLFADSDADGTPDDVNGDGVIDSSDAIATTMTDANGRYLFDGLPLDSYIIEVETSTLPASFNITPTYAPTGATGSRTDTVTLTEATPADWTQDFSYTYTDTNLGSIGDQIWGDLADDGNSTPDAIDVPFAGVELILISSSGYSATTTTDENGFYLFENLPADIYTVTVNHSTLPSGFDTIPSYDPDATDDGSSSITLAVGEDNRAQDFSYPPSATPVGMIGDTVWFDIDGDGNGPDDEGTAGGDDDEPGIEDVCVYLYQDLGTIGTFDPLSDTLLSSTYTDANGHYRFNELSLDDGDGDFDYVVVVNTDCLPPYVSPQSTYDNDTPVTDSVSFVNLDATSIATGSHINLNQDFGYEPIVSLGSIGDTIWFDVDGSGTSAPDAGELGLEGVTVVLTDEHGNTWTTTTDENGNYHFGDLPLNTTYTVTIPASNFASGGVLEGMTNTYDPDNNDDNAGIGVTLTNGTPVNLDQDFSYSGGAGQLGNLVWLDVNADGDNDAGETPIADVTLDLYRDLDCDGLLDAGEPLFGSTTTVGTVDAGAYGTNGVYDFDGLPTTASGTCWIVDVTDENGLLNGYWKSSGTQGTDDNSQADPYGDNGSGSLVLTNATPVNLTADFGYYLDPAAVGNFVWFDYSYDGVQDEANTAGVDGVTVTLQIDYPNGTVITLTTITGDDPSTTGTVESGWYSFGNLLLDEDYAQSSGTSSSMANQPAHVVSMTLPDGYSTSLVDESGAGITDLNDADAIAGVAAQATQGAQSVEEGSSTSEASYDFGIVRIELGDLPNGVYSSTLLSDNGARHIVYPDDDGDNKPDVTGAIWSGSVVDVEPDGQTGGDFGGSEGDDDDGTDDDDGVELPPQASLIDGNTVAFTVTLSSRGVQSADYGLWIDWNADGSFDDENEFLSRNDISINTPTGGDLFQTTFVLTTTVPSGAVAHPDWIYIRGRVLPDGSTVDANDFTGLAINGEVEDFAMRLLSPTTVELQSQQSGTIAQSQLMFIISFAFLTTISLIAIATVYRPKSLTFWKS